MSTGDPEDAFLTVAEVAATLKLNQQTVRNWIDQGRLPAVRIGRRVRVRRADIDKMSAERATVAPEPKDSVVTPDKACQQL